MKKLLLLLFLIPNMVMAEFDSQGALDEGYTQEQIDKYLKYQKWLDANPDKAGTEEYIIVQKAAETYTVIEEVDCSNLTKKEQKEFKKQCDRYYKVKRMQCAASSSRANSDFAAKKIYETCLDEAGVPKK